MKVSNRCNEALLPIKIKKKIHVEKLQAFIANPLPCINNHTNGCGKRKKPV